MARRQNKAPARALACVACVACLALLTAAPGLAAVVPGCECTGTTWPEQVLGPRKLPLNYGTSCEAWDDGACSEHACGDHQLCDEMWPDAVMGTWCCAAWCYIDPATCNLDDVERSALDPDGVNGQTQYYSYKACAAAETRYTPDTCPWEKDIGWEAAFSLCRTTARESGAPEIFLIQDLSGSYSDDVTRLNAMMDDLNVKLSAQFGQPRIGVGSFVDNPMRNGASTDYCYKTHQSITTNFTLVKDTYKTLPTYSGGDGPESQLDAILEAATDPQVQWSPEPEPGSNSTLRSKIILLTTDHETHIGMAGLSSSRCKTNSGDGYTTIEDARKALEDNHINLIFAVTENYMRYYQELACKLGRGQVVALKSDSSNLIEALTTSACVLTSVPKATLRIQLKASKADVIRIMPTVISEITLAAVSQVVTTNIIENLPGGLIDATFSILFSSDSSANGAVATMVVQGDSNPIKSKLVGEYGISGVTVLGVKSGVAQISSETEDECQKFKTANVDNEDNIPAGEYDEYAFLGALDDGGRCEYSTQCKSRSCKGGRCCGDYGKYRGCMYCDAEGDCRRCESGYRFQYDVCVLCDRTDECTWLDDPFGIYRTTTGPAAAASDLAASTAIAFGLVCVVGMVVWST